MTSTSAAEQVVVVDFLTVPEVAKMLRVRPRTVYGWVAAGRIPHHKPSRNLLLFDRVEVVAWVKGGGAEKGGAPGRAAIPFAPQGGRRSQP